ncbi:hypothetical protein ACJMK2_038442 [Sinanodonta woodiana]|uniref:Sushi domain-containing protein n=1 Tax=Sinanodonta woodiana TaxID=1069815 RepID=A0ABD3W907_SINWO
MGLWGFRFMLLLLAEFCVRGSYDLDGECPERLTQYVHGRECRKACEVDSDCNNPQMECKCDRLCGRSCIKKGMRCHSLRLKIPHGRVLIDPSNKFNGLARYYCDDGYRIYGVPVRICQGDETWSGEEPECLLGTNLEASSCSLPPQIHHAYHDGVFGQERFLHQTGLLYRCVAGYTLQPSSVPNAWCVMGTWIGPNMTCAHAGCPILAKIPKGRVEIDLRSGSGGVAIYQCDAGFFLAGRSERMCLPTGQWEGEEPRCVKVICPSPPRVAHAHYAGYEGQSSYLPGSELLYACDDGYYSEGNPRAVCKGDGRWMGLSLRCLPIYCDDPGDVENGFRKLTGFHFGNNVTFFCNIGYEIEGSAIRTCDKSGTWTGLRTSCKAVTCPNLQAPQFGRMLGTGNTYGTVLHFECEPRYRLIGSLQRACLADRKWSGTEAKCDEINCGWPRKFWNGYFVGHTTTLGSRIYYNCNVRTTFQVGGHFSAVCMDNGEWSAPPPVCLGQCQVPSLSNASIHNARELTWLDHDSILEYNCRNGLVKRTSVQVKCYNGSWSYIPECVPSPCFTPPPHIHSGMRIYFGQDHGDRAKYLCFPGHKLLNISTESPFLTCKFGQWTGGTPVCQEEYCINPGTITNGTTFLKGIQGKFVFKHYIRTIKHGTRLVYECDRGFRLIGPGGATCVNGEWQPNLRNPGTKCEEAKHPPPVKLWIPLGSEK